MEVGTVGAGTIAGILFTLVVSIGLPLALVILLCKKTKAGMVSFLTGGATFFLFAMVLEQILHFTVLGIFGEETLTNNIWVYGLYGGLAAALFEETGRFTAMRFFMKKRLDLPNALMYGVGHGGIEAVLIVGLSSISNLVTSIMINSGGMESTLNALDPAVAGTVMEQLSALWTLPAYQFFLGGAERIFAIFSHIAFSVLVYVAVRYKKKSGWLLAFAMHFLVDFAAVVGMNYLSVVAVEGIVALLTAVTVCLAVRMIRVEKSEQDILSE
ncbi:MAG: YhfC family intramembrane metalloprotease [Muribaculaceae bacterium]|nr:YhfC family intramembrane metalloprotease [Roseburia sp.]MCM1431677.1 YhfC family intramembrane metalloprotease [Muribaculaceae bacterium]MCM1491651.1 YhfC family intramembrane metalloprotease [Muribaculaceae bacterium]